MWSRAAVVDAVAALELVELAAQLELDAPGEHDEELLGVSVRVGFRARRSSRIELADEHLEVMERARREQELPPENAERERRSFVATEHSRHGRPAWLEQVRNAHAERIGDAAERGDARARPAALDLAEEAFADTRAVRDRSERTAPQAAYGTKSLSDVDFANGVDGVQISLDPVEGKLKRPYGSVEAVSTTNWPRRDQRAENRAGQQELHVCR